MTCKLLNEIIHTALSRQRLQSLPAAWTQSSSSLRFPARRYTPPDYELSTPEPNYPAALLHPATDLVCHVFSVKCCLTFVRSSLLPFAWIGIRTRYKRDLLSHASPALFHEPLQKFVCSSYCYDRTW